MKKTRKIYIILTENLKCQKNFLEVLFSMKAKLYHSKFLIVKFFIFVISFLIVFKPQASFQYPSTILLRFKIFLVYANVKRTTQFEMYHE